MSRKIVYTWHAKERIKRRGFTELDIEAAIERGAKIAIIDEPNKFAFRYQTASGRKYEVVCYIIGNVYKVKTVYPI